MIDVPMDVPTDWTRAIPHGIYALYQETNDEKIVEKYEEAIMKAIDNSPKDLWCAVNVLFFQLEHEMMKKSPFNIEQSISKKVKDKMSFFRRAIPIWKKRLEYV